MRPLVTALLTLCLLTTLAPAAAADWTDVETRDVREPALVALLAEAATFLGTSPGEGPRELTVGNFVGDLSVVQLPGDRHPPKPGGPPPVVLAFPVTVGPCPGLGPHPGVGVYVSGHLFACSEGELVGMSDCTSPITGRPGHRLWVRDFSVCA